MNESEPGRDAALAAFDRSLDEAAPAPVLLGGRAEPDSLFRAGEDTTSTTLRMDLDGLVIDALILARGDLRSLTGLVRGEFDHLEVRLYRPWGCPRLFVTVDGGFRSEGLRRGPASLTVERPGHPPVAGDWFVL
ncbi:carboxypeptidase regulatory-like domain-containing protein [Nocardiopsis alba]|uniref:carboxypeptidase regulatory-like domain-containing protein n=1 Tax=Nocardiopsis alba TaxID=53437 RepID=UPI00364A2FC2